mmetsp:Transcript_40377/g.61607  ORF Transcript_40377/g.61607 Transcript_40377/m.61607 type:complete len:141 (-) Transcript_40377:71-493(-)
MQLGKEKLRANVPRVKCEDLAYFKDLPEFDSKYTHIVEIKNGLTQKLKIVACVSREKAEHFTKCFNLVACFSECALCWEEDSGSNVVRMEGHLQVNAEERARIEEWVQGFVLVKEEGKGETLRFCREVFLKFSNLFQLMS